MKNVRKKLLSILIIIILTENVISIGGKPVQATTTSHAFDSTAGLLSVDYSGYLSKHDIVYKTPVADPKDGALVANGKIGGMIWNTSGYSMQVTGVDNSPQTSVSGGRIKLGASPAMDANYTSFEQRMVMYDGVVTTKYDADRTITTFGQPGTELMGIHVENSRSGVTGGYIDLDIWDTSGLSNGTYTRDLPDLTTWRTVTTLVESVVIAISRGQTDVDHYGYTLATSVQGTTFTTQLIDSRTLRINLTNASSYTVWISSASRITSPSYDSVTQAKSLIVAAKTA